MWDAFNKNNFKIIGLIFLTMKFFNTFPDSKMFVLFCAFLTLQIVRSTVITTSINAGNLEASVSNQATKNGTLIQNNDGNGNKNLIETISSPSNPKNNSNNERLAILDADNQKALERSDQGEIALIQNGDNDHDANIIGDYLGNLTNANDNRNQDVVDNLNASANNATGENKLVQQKDKDNDRDRYLDDGRNYINLSSRKMYGNMSTSLLVDIIIDFLEKRLNKLL